MKTRRPRARLVVLGGRVDLVLSGGRTFVLPADYGMVIDPSGRSLGKCRLWLTRVHATGERIEKLTDYEQDWFGSDYDARRAIVDLPRDGWELRSHVAEIVYFRSGQYEDDWRHAFEEPQPLYESRGSWLLDLPSDCVVNWRGIVRP
jgi:hypothetical protein